MCVLQITVKSREKSEDEIEASEKRRAELELGGKVD